MANKTDTDQDSMPRIKMHSGDAVLCAKPSHVHRLSFALHRGLRGMRTGFSSLDSK